MSKILVPVSGGKDSTVSLLLAINEQGKENVTAVFNDTGWDHPVTYEYLDYLRDTLGIEIHSTVGPPRKDGTPASDLISLIRAQGRFPFGLGRFCTTHLKQVALRKWYEANLFDGKTEYEFWFGMRQQESGQRARKYAGITADDVFDMSDLFPGKYTIPMRKLISVRLPVVEWSEDAIFTYLERKGIERNPLYYEGTNDRVGCYPCMLAGKKVQAAIFSTEVGKERLEIIRGLEKELGQKYEMHDTDQGSCEVCKI